MKLQNFNLSLQQNYLDQPMSIMARHLSHVPISEVGYAPKSIIKPSSCIQLQNHYCMTKRKGSKGTLYVDPLKATSNHYKRCHLTRDECKQLMSTTYLDDTMLKYTDQDFFSHVLEKVIRLFPMKLNGSKSVS